MQAMGKAQPDRGLGRAKSRAREPDSEWSASTPASLAANPGLIRWTAIFAPHAEEWEMDAERFDSLARSLASRFSRRRALRGAGAAASAGLLAATGTGRLRVLAQNANSGP